MSLVAQTVKVVHNTSYDHQGRSKLGSGKPVVQKIVHAYMDGRIRTSSGDCWDVVANPNQKESNFITVLPSRKEKE
jgi:hypothetical protein